MASEFERVQKQQRELQNNLHESVGQLVAKSSLTLELLSRLEEESARLKQARDAVNAAQDIVDARRVELDAAQGVVDDTQRALTVAREATRVKKGETDKIRKEKAGADALLLAHWATPRLPVLSSSALVHGGSRPSHSRDSVPKGKPDGNELQAVQRPGQRQQPRSGKRRRSGSSSATRPRSSRSRSRLRKKQDPTWSIARRCVVPCGKDHLYVSCVKSVGTARVVARSCNNAMCSGLASRSGKVSGVAQLATPLFIDGIPVKVGAKVVPRDLLRPRITPRPFVLDNVLAGGGCLLVCRMGKDTRHTIHATGFDLTVQGPRSAASIRDAIANTFGWEDPSWDPATITGTTFICTCNESAVGRCPAAKMVAHWDHRWAVNPLQCVPTTTTVFDNSTLHRVVVVPTGDTGDAHRPLTPEQYHRRLLPPGSNVPLIVADREDNDAAHDQDDDGGGGAAPQPPKQPGKRASRKKKSKAPSLPQPTRPKLTPAAAYMAAADKSRNRIQFEYLVAVLGLTVHKKG